MIHKCVIIVFTFSALITTISDGAGTLLLYEPGTSFHDDFDIDYRNVCCNRGGGCEKFLSTHPINDGSGYKPPQGCAYLIVTTLLVLTGSLLRSS